MEAETMNTFILIVIIAVPIIVVAGLFFFFGFKGKGGQLREKDWTLDSYSTTMKLDDPPAKGSLVSFDIPNTYPGVHMVSKRISGLPKGGSMSIKFEISGTTPKFVAGGLTPELRLHIGGARLYSFGSYACTLKLGSQCLMFHSEQNVGKRLTVSGVIQMKVTSTSLTKLSKHQRWWRSFLAMNTATRMAHGMSTGTPSFG